MNLTPVRFNAIYEDLALLNKNLAALPGRKQVLWITYGIPSDIHFAVGWKDLGATLRDLAAQFNANHVAIYTLDPGMAFGTLNRNGLDILSAATGGRAFGAIDVNKAVKQARSDNRATYALTYDPQSVPNESGKVHEVRLKCKRKDVRIFSQQLYVGALR